MWRPDDWDNPYYDDFKPNEAFQAYEVGADAMLEALKKKGSYHNIQRSIGSKAVSLIHFYMGDDEAGWLVFIPEEE